MTDRRLSLLLDGYTFFEGPRWHEDRWWVSDMYTHQVLTVDGDGRADVVVEVEGQPSGLGWMPDGRLLVVSMKDRRLLRLEGTTLRLHADLGHLVRGNTNDMVVDQVGRAYVGNFGFDMMSGAARKPANLVRVDPDGTAIEVADDLSFPNGTVITADGGTLDRRREHGRAVHRLRHRRRRVARQSPGVGRPWPRGGARRLCPRRRRPHLVGRRLRLALPPGRRRG